MFAESLLQLLVKKISNVVTKQRKMILKLVLSLVIDTVSIRNLEHSL